MVDEQPTPRYVVSGFRAKVGNLMLTVGYAVYDTPAVLLFATETIGTQQPTLWRQFWTSRERAIDAAEELCGACVEYLEEFQAPFRPCEDFEYDDFVEHLRLRLSNQFH